MSYKTEFQSNNTDLQTILETVNTLPDSIDIPLEEVPLIKYDIQQFEILKSNLSANSMYVAVYTCDASGSAKFMSVIFRTNSSGEVSHNTSVISSDTVNSTYVADLTSSGGGINISWSYNHGWTVSSCKVFKLV